MHSHRCGDSLYQKHGFAIRGHWLVLCTCLLSGAKRTWADTVQICFWPKADIRCLNRHHHRSSPYKLESRLRWLGTLLMAEARVERRLAAILERCGPSF